RTDDGGRADHDRQGGGDQAAEDDQTEQQYDRQRIGFGARQIARHQFVQIDVDRPDTGDVGFQVFGLQLVLDGAIRLRNAVLVSAGQRQDDPGGVPVGAQQTGITAGVIAFDGIDGIFRQAGND